MRQVLVVLLLCSTAAGCTVNSGVKTTPSFTRATQVNVPVPAAPKLAARVVSRETGSSAFVSPTLGSMQGATWVIDDFSQDRIYRLPLQPQRVTTILLAAGERLNSITGGNYEGFVVSNSYVGSRPAISIMPSWAGVSGNLHLSTSGTLYSLYAYTARNNINLVDFRQGEGAGGAASGTATADASLVPQGDYTELTLTAPSGTMPAWAPVKAWADSYKLVVRFQGPLPVMPALFAGGEGEQVISYRVVDDHGDPTMITDRRVTEGQLRVDQEVVAISAAKPAAPHDWRQAGALPPSAQPVVVVVPPARSDAQSFQAGHAIGGAI